MICKSNNKDESINCANCVNNNNKKTIFDSLSTDEVSCIANYVEKKSTYSAGEYLINEHEEANFSLCIDFGYLILGTHLEDGSRQIFKVVFPGESIGFSNNKGDYSYFVQAVTDSEVCIINDASVKKLLEDHSSVALHLVDILSNNANSYQQYLLGLGRKNAQEALAYLIMDVSTKVKQSKGLKCNGTGEDLCFFPLNQEDMADVLGLTKVHISRVMSQFKKDNLIRCAHKKLNVLDVSALSDIGGYPLMAN